MKERPILFKGEMVRAILEGRKTQTRRVAEIHDGFMPTWEYGRIKSKHPHQGKFGAFIQRDSLNGRKELDILPSDYGAPGDRLWVKETFKHIGNKCESSTPERVSATVVYQSDGETRECGNYECFTKAPREKWWNETRAIWKPSIFMRREFSRINLEITAVRVERLQDISAQDARAEGVRGHDNQVDANAIGRYRELWESINGKESWAANPWVWVIEFKKL